MGQPTRDAHFPAGFNSSYIIGREEPAYPTYPPEPFSGDPCLDYSYGQDEAPELAPGLRVRHPVFGPGTVLAVMGTGPGQKLRIRFERAGVKTIVLRFANLELG